METAGGALKRSRALPGPEGGATRAAGETWQTGEQRGPRTAPRTRVLGHKSGETGTQCLRRVCGHLF